MGGTVARIVLWAGILLVLIGLVGRYIIGLRGGSGIIPLLFGMPITVLGLIALEPNYFKASMRGVSALALLGLLATLNVLPRLSALLRGVPPPDGVASILVRGAMLLLCSVLLSVCTAAFLHAWWKRARG